MFPDELFADLFTDRGRRSVPPSVVATVMVLPDVHRLCLTNTTHLELTDLVLITARDRTGVLPGGGKREPHCTIDLVNAFVRAHFDSVLLGTGGRFPHEQLDEFGEVTSVDLTPVREWARARERDG